jgi:hypothetical protein
MRSRIFVAAAAGLVLTGAATAAHAQLTPMGLMLRAGIFMPTSGAGGAVGDSWFTAGAEMDLFKPGFGFIPLPLDPKITLSVDAYNKSGVSAVPVLMNLRIRQGALRFSAGVGLAFSDTLDDDSSTEFAFQVSGGYDLPWLGLPLTAELRYFGVQGVGTALDGFAFTIGFRL